MHVQAKSTTLKIASVNAPPKPHGGIDPDVAALLQYTYQQILVHQKSGDHIVRLSMIGYLEADGNYTRIHLTDGRVIYTSKTLKHWELCINSPFFFRSHSSYLLNIHKVTQLDSRHTYATVLDKEIPVSRRRKNGIITALRQ